MANQAYNGQPINIQFDYEGEGTMDSKLVQLSESAAKDPTTWLKNGIYRIGNGQPVFTQDGKAFIYIGRKGNATDIADNSKWVQLATLNNIPSSISNAAKFKGVVNSAPANAEAGDMYIASDYFGISLGDSEPNEDIPYYAESVERNGETVTEYFEQIEKGDLIIYGDNGVFYVLQKNLITDGGIVTVPTGTDRDCHDCVAIFQSTENHDWNIIPTSISYDDLLKLVKAVTMKNASNENTFISEVKALKEGRNITDTEPFEFFMNMYSNFFGFAKTQPYVRATFEGGGASGSGIHDVIHFRNYDLEGTLSSPCVEYTYDLDTKTLSYQKFIEVTVSNS